MGKLWTDHLLGYKVVDRGIGLLWCSMGYARVIFLARSVWSSSEHSNLVSFPSFFDVIGENGMLEVLRVVNRLFLILSFIKSLFD